ncbi:MAG: hypothetical protein LWY06_01780 [Firmicutes bacterium]|nr:hypothetical protein [Bacillota bacterium]
MKRNIAILALLLAAAAFFCNPAFAWPRQVNGKPAYKPGKNFGYYIWHLDKSWHVRSTSKKGVHVFSGIVKGDKKLNLKYTIPLGAGDYVYLLNEKTIKFRMTTEKLENGFDFTTSGNSLTFELELDKNKAPKDVINLGLQRNHPTTNPVVVNR